MCGDSVAAPSVELLNGKGGGDGSRRGRGEKLKGTLALALDDSAPVLLIKLESFRNQVCVRVCVCVCSLHLFCHNFFLFHLFLRQGPAHRNASTRSSSARWRRPCTSSTSSSPCSRQPLPSTSCPVSIPTSDTYETQSMTFYAGGSPLPSVKEPRLGRPPRGVLRGQRARRACWGI